MNMLEIIVAGIVGLVIGIFIGKLLFDQFLKKKKKDSLETAKKIVADAQRDAESIKRDKILEAKEKFLQLKTDFEQKAEAKKKEITESENRVKNRQSELDKQLEQVKQKEAETSSIKETLNRQLDLVSIKKKELEKSHEEHIQKLEKISKLSAVDAKAQLIESLKEEARTEGMSYIKTIMDESKLKANKEAKKIIIQTIQRTAAEQAIENAVSVFNLETDDTKGQIIGREGRNIRALEAATGVEIIIDDTPEAVVISGFDPVRREVARLSLQRLVADGRIHPARIEEVVARTRKEMNEHITEIGERTVIDLGVHGLNSALVTMVGRMRFRSSYGQNLLQHSRETANMSAIMAADLGLNPKSAKRAGLLHDIGKVPDEEPELSHAILGMKLAEKYGESAAVCNAIGAHHDEIDMTYAISPIIQACDAISGSRPGARRETMDTYLKRLKDLEDIALGFEGIEKAYAIQAGRELRIIVEHTKVSDADAEKLSFSISQKIQEEMQYPGQIKVAVIRETRAISFAK